MTAMLPQDAALKTAETSIKYEIEKWVVIPSHPDGGEWWVTGWGFNTIEHARLAVSDIEAAGRKARVFEVVTTRREV